MVINKITVGWVTQIFDVDKKRFISQEFFAGDQVDYEQIDGIAVSTEYLEMDEKEIYHSFEMVQPVTITVRLHDADDESLGIIRTNINEDEFEKLLDEYTSQEKDIDDFIEFCKKKYPDYLCERFFINREMKLNI